MSSSTSACAVSASPPEADAIWTTICPLDAIPPEAGVCALVGGVAIAVFRVGDRVFALDDRDPFTGARVLSRGIVGDRGGVLKVASPLHKQSFALESGACLDAAGVAVAVYAVRVREGMVEIGGVRGEGGMGGGEQETGNRKRETGNRQTRTQTRDPSPQTQNPDPDRPDADPARPRPRPRT